MRAWDSSAVVPLLVQEAASHRLLSLLRDDPSLVVWWGPSVECVSALSRLERGGKLASAGATHAIERLRLLQASWNEVEPAEVLRETAERLLRVHPLRAADSLQLAAAILASNHRPGILAFVCCDERLSAAALREGFPVISN